jgi:hypothetical protein
VLIFACGPVVLVLSRRASSLPCHLATTTPCLLLAWSWLYSEWVLACATLRPRGPVHRGAGYTTAFNCTSTQAKRTSYSFVYSPAFLPADIWYACIEYIILATHSVPSLLPRLTIHATLKQRTVGVPLGRRGSQIGPWQLSAPSERRDNKRTWK